MNGTVVIEIVLNVGTGDEVIVSAFTFYSTISAVLAVGAVSVIVDVTQTSMSLNRLHHK